MANNSTILLYLLTLLVLLRSTNGVTTVNVMDYGAKGDGVTDDSGAFLKGWTAVCNTSQAATLSVPSGQFLLQHPTLFQGPCVNTKFVLVQIDGHLTASSNYSLYSSYWLKFHDVKGLTFQGAGYLDGKGSQLWSCKASEGNCPDGASSLVFDHAKDINLTGITSVNSELFNIVIDSSSNVRIDGLTIQSPGTSPNTDGIHVEESTGVTITNTVIKAGDDCISIGPGTQNLRIEKVTCGPGHGISVGSLGKNVSESGVQNVNVKNVSFTNSENGLRIKSWGGPSNGSAKGVVFDGATMTNVTNPIIIDQHYCPHNEKCRPGNSGVQISNVTYNNIKGTSATQVAVNFSCSASAPCQGIKISNVQLTYKGQPAKAYCQNAYVSSSGTLVPTISSCPPLQIVDLWLSSPIIDIM